MMERRRFMKGLAATPLALMLAEMGCKQDQQTGQAASNVNGQPGKKTTRGAKTLNVYVHGMFAIVLDETQSPPVAVLKAPYVPDHSYQAQTFTINSNNQNDLDDGKLTYSVMQGSNKDTVTFYDKTPRSLSIPAEICIGCKDHIAIKNPKPSESVKPFWTVTLPMPDHICGLRASYINYFSSLDFSKQGKTWTDNKMSIDQRMPLIYVLSYQNLDIDVAAGKYVKFNDVVIDFGTDDVGRLHLYAERTPVLPTPPSDGCNPNMAIDQFNQLFNPATDLKFWSSLCDPSFGVAIDDQLPSCKVNSMVLCDERCLGELKDKCVDFGKQETLKQQFANFIAVEANLDLQATLAGENRHLTQGQYKALVAAAPYEQKPPHNCTSVLCLERKNE